MRAWRTGQVLVALCVATGVPRAAAAQLDAPRVPIAENLRIDGTMQDFVALTGVYVAPDGRIAVPQPRDGKVTIFSPDGKLLVTFAGVGDGPGEFRGLAALGWRGDTIWVNDTRARRVSMFTSRGRHIATLSLANVAVGPRVTGVPPGLATYSPVAYYSDGSMLVNRGAPSRDSPPTIIARMNARGELERVVLQHPLDGAAFTIANNAGGQMFSSLPFINGFADMVAPDGSRVGYLETVLNSTGGTIRAIIVASSGDTLLSRTIPFAGRRVTQAEKDSVVAARIKQQSGPATRFGPGGVTEQIMRAPDPEFNGRLEALLRSRMPAFHAPIIAARFGLDNTIWVQTRATATEAVWVMFSEKAEPEFSVALPARTRLVQASRTSIWAIQLDDDDIPSVVRYGVTRAR